MSIFFSPAFLLFLTIAVGLTLGRIKIYGISLGISAVLLTAIGAGVLLSRYAQNALPPTFAPILSDLSSIGTALFLSAVGLSSGFTIKKAKGKKMLLSFGFGSLLVMLGFLVSRLLPLLDASLSIDLTNGLFCGAMTSSPALASVCESGINAEEATLGYGLAYPVGVTATVLWTQAMIRHATRGTEHIDASAEKTGQKANLLPVMASICVLGTCLGKCPLIDTILGGTGAILFVSLLTGALLSLREYRHNKNELSAYRTLGLLLFFVGNGLSAGISFSSGVKLYHLLYALAIALLPLTVGTIICKIVLRSSMLNAACLVAGGMTSTPALGAVLEKKEAAPDLSLYSFSYIGALLTATLLPKIL